MDPPNSLGAGPNPDLGWKKEAHAVIRDVEAHVKLIAVAEHIKVRLLVDLSEIQIFLPAEKSNIILMSSICYHLLI